MNALGTGSHRTTAVPCYMHVDASGSEHVPAVPPSPAAMQLEGFMQLGPFAESQAAPSAAGAEHVPGTPVDAPVQTPPPLQNTVWSLTSFVPHGCPVDPSVIVAHCFVMVLQVRSCVWSQPGPVCDVGSQVAPDVATACWQVPVTPVELSAPTQ